MKVLYVGLYYAPDMTAVGKYAGEMCEYMHHEAGIDVKVIAPPPFYPRWSIDEAHRNWFANENIKDIPIHRVPIYIPTNPGLLKRLLHLVSFSLSAGIRLLAMWRYKPDIVITVQPTLFLSLWVLLYCKVNGAKAMMHIQDFEIDAMLNSGISKSNFLVRLIQFYETWLYRHHHFISSISKSMCRLAAQRGRRDDIYHFPNWVDFSIIEPNTKKNEKLAELLGINLTKSVIMYAGNIGKKQGFETLLEVIDQFSDCQFVIAGDGVHRKQLQQNINKRGLSNVLYLPLQPEACFNDFLNLADIHLVMQKRNVASVVLPSKLGNILAVAGYCVVTSEVDSELGILASEHKGIIELCEPEQPKLLARSIRKVLNKINDCQSNKNTAALKFAKQYLQKDKILAAMVLQLQKQVL